MEFTNPFIQLRWYLTFHEKTKELLFKIVDRTFIILFFYIRIFLLTYYTFLIWTKPELNFTADDYLFSTLGLLIGYGLAWHMIIYLINVYKQSKIKVKDEDYKNGHVKRTWLNSQ
jgi:hypothetical protein